MKFLDILNLIPGRFQIPAKAVDPGSPLPSELWQVIDELKYRNVANGVTLTVLVDALINVANGVAGLDATGKIPAGLLPGSITSVTSVPIGGFIDYGGDPSNAPAGFLVRDGSEYLKTEYPSLAAALGSRWGRAQSDLYFRVPDSIGRVTYGAWPFPNTGLIHRVNIKTRGQGYSPGTYAFTFSGGTFSVAATGVVTIANEFVSGVGSTGVVTSVEITNPGTYTSLGTPSGDGVSNVGLTIPGAALPGGLGCTYEIFAQPVAAVRAPYAFAIPMTAHGTGYTSTPGVSFVGGSLVGATAIAILRDGGVGSIVLTNPGNGNIAGTTVVITGGGGTGATAALRAELQYVQLGDYLGEEKHTQLLAELATHQHGMQFNANGSGNNGYAVADGTSTTLTAHTEDAGSSFPLPFRSPGVGAVPLIRAV